MAGVTPPQRAQNPEITLEYLKSMVGADGRPLNIIQKIAAGNYKDFGMYLLNDENMTVVSILVKQHINDIKGTTDAIILEWKNAFTSHTWKHLIDCIRKCGLGALAEDIKNALPVTPVPTPADSSASSSTSKTSSRVADGSSGSHPVATDDGGPAEAGQLTKPVAPGTLRLSYYVSAEYKTEFVQLQSLFGSMFESILEMVKAHIPVDKLKHYLSQTFPEFEESLKDCDTVDDVMKAVRKECSLTDCSYLEEIGKKFELQECQRAIDNYRSIVKSICHHTLTEHSYVKCFRDDYSQISSDKITFKLMWDAKKKTLTDIRDFLQMAFEKLAARIQIEVINVGCVVVVCWFPRILEKQLVKIAEGKVAELTQMGVVSLTVGSIELIVERARESTLETVQPLWKRSSGIPAAAATAGDGGPEKKAADDHERPKYPMELIDDMSTIYDPLLPLNASQQEEIKKFAANQVNVIIQSCNNAEYYAALEKMKAATASLPMFVKPVKYPTSKYTIVVGTFAGKNAAIVRTDQGNKSRNDLKEILGYFPHAKYLLGLGVCMGIKGKFGDVLIGKMVQIEENLKLENGKLVLRGPCEPAKQTMKNIFCDDTAGWKGFECTATAEGSTSNPRTSRVFPGCILSSSALLNDKDIKQELEKASQALIGAEMEGWVLFTAFKDIESIIIKGISDYGDGTKADDWQLTAAKAAVDYAHFKLERSFLD